MRSEPHRESPLGIWREPGEVLTQLELKKEYKVKWSDTDNAFWLCTGCVTLDKSPNLVELPLLHLFHANSSGLPGDVDITEGNT